jgi:hypothetical protein
MNETSGALRPAMEAYLYGEPMQPIQVAAVRAYLRQWMEAPWKGPMIDVLLRTAEGIIERDDITRQSRSCISRVPSAHGGSHRLGMRAVPNVSRRGTD